MCNPGREARVVRRAAWSTTAATARTGASMNPLTTKVVNPWQNLAQSEIRIEALAKLGELLPPTEQMAKGTRSQLRGRDSSGATKAEVPEKDATTLSEMGIDWKESSQAKAPDALSGLRAGDRSSTIPTVGPRADRPALAA